MPIMRSKAYCSMGRRHGMESTVSTKDEVVWPSNKMNAITTRTRCEWKDKVDRGCWEFHPERRKRSWRVIRTRHVNEGLLRS